MTVPASIAERRANVAARSAGVAPVEKQIKLRAQRDAVAEALQKAKKLSPLAARILAARGFELGAALDHFLDPTLKNGLDDPENLKGLNEAAALIAANIDNGIGICCDFDVDGLSGGAQLAAFFQSAGVPYEVFVPDRFEDGYGLNEKMVNGIVARKFGLLICVDYGTTSVKELTVAKAKGLKTIVIDHHHVEGKAPPCDVFINPQQKGCGFAGKILCASGLVWYVVMRLRKLLADRVTVDTREFLELACLGTICDLVPLSGSNRVIAKKGLEALAQSQRPGIKALKKVMGIKAAVSSFDVSFGIGPRINAAGRMVNGSSVIELLTTRDDRIAEKLAKELHQLNIERQEAEAIVKEAAIEVVRDLGQLPAGLVVWREDFHTGVIGIVAQRLVELFYRPSIVLGADKGGIFKGSVRGVKGFSVVEALAECSELLIKYGGHQAAGGLSIYEENLDEFAARFSSVCLERLGEHPKPPIIETDTVADLSEISIPSVQELRAFAPFGMGNATPTVLLKNVRIQSVSILKDTHTKIIMSYGDRALTGFLWRRTDHPAIAQGAVVHAACKLDINTFQGMESVQATIEALQAVDAKSGR